jgi:two-component system, LytTR family, sensor kinase
VKKIKFNNSIRLRHFLNWSLIIILRHLIVPIEDDLIFRLFRSLVEFTIYAAGYYFFCIFISPFIQKSRFKYYIPLIIVYLCVWSFLFFLVEYGPGMYYTEKFIYPKFGEIGYYFSYIALLGLLAHGFYQKQVSIQSLNEESNKSQIGLMQELLFFKNQFNDHISFNFLNLCYSQTMENDPSTANSIATYSQMLKYTLNAKPSQAVPLHDEVVYIDQFISLHEQIGKEIYIDFKKTYDIQDFYILPRILINFIDNAFKYGITDDEAKPIKISLIRHDKTLNFNITNHKKGIIEKMHSTRTGQINARKQLDLYYENKYQLSIIEDENMYTCDLMIESK